ncbi:Glucosamine--fructose-6-phosphate aminotransferase (isomerizing) [Thioalkalivibrio nitratireducens DSM 14787]|uniref:Glutamine--fructose-6-phosphate aminotransferase [isomerizing] n=1 Tax=Thioalkalivibrio nitratireducens (strain DSM 14787 / UNIQEM 213 / ALEN2) TaxID=1255043 RepID=L0E272_THIND|nr:glutamine--fructose-6-phosphate transaminase (isomerizing) [Thioalkalivibrio nitratireducens]AGA35347.1 Glucosamine--fructose-6-phosphate aminotransferase (isomerizing) [Thioalkalivibrio nitratireducens DSM 14787]
MCGIVAGIAERNIVPILIEGLRSLEYRGYDSAGVAVLADGALLRERTLGKVATLADAVERSGLKGTAGIAHTRWATHGAPSSGNAHPHVSAERIAVVHNGIIENHAELRAGLQARGHRFTSETDTEVIAHLICEELGNGSGDLLIALRAAARRLHGAYAVAAIDREAPERIVLAREGSPLVIGLGIGENFAASDIQALLPVTQRFVDLEDGDFAVLERLAITVVDADGHPVHRPVRESSREALAADRGAYRHFMLKEIHEQPEAIAATLEGRLGAQALLPNLLGPDTAGQLAAVRAVQIVACGTSYHAGMVARYWLEATLGLPCQVEVASEFRYRPHVVQPGTLLVVISQSGETADTLAVLKQSRQEPFCARLAICNVPESAMVRNADLVLMTHAGPEIGVASTKAFTTQLVALALLVLLLAEHAPGTRMNADTRAEWVQALRALPEQIREVLSIDAAVAEVAEQLVERQHALFLGRGQHFPIALEGALKLKEISYIHAEAYPSGELKHGPLALVDADMPVVAVAPNDPQLEKLASNLQEVRARGGELIVFADCETSQTLSTADAWIGLPCRNSFPWLAPILFTVPLQLLAYHTAVLKGTDVDQPRNLAKSVTVE